MLSSLKCKWRGSQGSLTLLLSLGLGMEVEPRLKLLRASASLCLATRGNAACVSWTALLSFPLALGVALLQYIYYPRQRLGSPFLGHHLLSWNEIVSLSRWGIVGEQMRVCCEERFPVQGQ